MAELKIAGETFNVMVEGPERAPVIMLSNSLGTNLHMWDGQMAALTPTFRVVRYDSRGHGKSPVSGGALSIAGLGRDALAIMDALELDRVHWLGLSMGGMVGQWLLVNARERIGRAILANTAAQMAPPDLWNTRIRTALSQGMGAIVPAVIERWFTPAFQTRAPAEVARIVAMLRETPAHGYGGCCAAIRDMDQREAIRSISNPVLVIVGKDDPSTPPAAGALIQAAIRDARLVTLEAAHLSNIEAAAAFNSAVLAFMLDKSLRFPPPVAAAVKKAASVKVPAKSSARKTAARKTPAHKAVAPRKAAKPGVARKIAKKPSKAVATKKVAAKSTAKKRAPAKKPIAQRKR